VEADLGLEGVVLLGRDVRRVRDNEVEGPFDAGDKIALDEASASVHARACEVLSGEGEGALRAVDGDDLSAGMLVRDRERDRAGADPDVEDPRLGKLGEEREAALDDDFGLRPRDERPVVHLEKEPAKTPLAEDVAERLAPETALDELAEPLRLEGRDGASGRGELGAGKPEHIGHENLGVDARRRHPGSPKLTLDLVDRIQGHHYLFAADSHGVLTPRPLRAPGAAPRLRGLP